MGKLIVIEGLDASGKETQSKRLKETLLSRGVNAKRVEFPNYKSKSSELVKMYLSGDFGKNAGDVNAYASSTFYAADRFATYKTEFADFYLGGGVVIADRYTTSNIIHQAGKMTDELEKTEFLSWLDDFEYSKLQLPRPDLVIFLDMPVETGIKLMEARQNKADGTSVKDIHERDKKYLHDTYTNAKSMAERFGWRVICCAENGEPRSIDDIAADILNVVGDIL